MLLFSGHSKLLSSQISSSFASPKSEIDETNLLARTVLYEGSGRADVFHNLYSKKAKIRSGIDTCK